MIKWIRDTVFIKVLWGFMSIYLFNISVDAPEAENFIQESFFNEQESIVEIVVEQVLGYEEAIDEHDENKCEDQNQKKNSKLDIDIQYFSNSIFETNFSPKKTANYNDFSEKISGGFYQLFTPPPQA